MDKLPIQRIRTWTFRANGPDNELDDLSKSQLLREQKRLSLSLTGDESDEIIASPFFKEVQRYIATRAKSIWSELIVKVLNGLGEESCASQHKARISLLAIVSKVATILKARPDCSLNDIVDGLEVHDRTLRRDGLDALLKEDASELYVHLVFHVVGWITALWDPVVDENSTCFKVADDQSRSRTRSLLHTPTVRHLSAHLREANVPIYQLLTRFGDLLPRPESLLNDVDLGRFDIESACITAAYVSFHNLKNVLNIKIQWTRTLNQHLEYDRRRNVLHVFSEPSICALNLPLSGDSILAKLFDQSRDSRDSSSFSNQYADFRIYLSEILLSYRLVFGWHKKSRKRISLELPVDSSASSQGEICDPLLRALCTKEDTSDEIRALFLELGVEKIADYVSLEEFQFLGKRLLRLERISKSQSPSGLRRFWNDRRAPTAWFATWAVLILGGGTLILQAFQLVFQIYQPFGG